MVKFIALLIVSIAVLALLPERDAAKSLHPKHAIFVLFENGGSIADSKQAQSHDAVFRLLDQIAQLRKRKETQDTQVFIITSAQPNDIGWSGKPAQIFKQAKGIKDLLAFKRSFSDLVLAFEQIETTLQLTQPDTTSLYWIGSTVHVPFQRVDGPLEIQVPQAVPEALALPRFSEKLSTLKIMHVHPDQDEILRAYLGANGILKRAQLGDLEFALLGSAQTNANLDNLL